MGDSGDHEPGADWTGRLVAMSSPIKHRTGLSITALLLGVAANLTGLSTLAINGPIWGIWVLLSAAAAFFAFIAYGVRVHDRTWGASPLGTSRKGGSRLVTGYGSTGEAAWPVAPPWTARSPGREPIATRG